MRQVEVKHNHTFGITTFWKQGTNKLCLLLINCMKL